MSTEQVRDEMKKFKVHGEIIKRTKLGYKSREAIFEIDAEDREDAKFLFYHGAHLAFIPKGWELNRMDYRTLAAVKELK